jgi:hypothetical protein
MIAALFDDRCMTAALLDYRYTISASLKYILYPKSSFVGTSRSALQDAPEALCAA